MQDDNNLDAQFMAHDYKSRRHIPITVFTVASVHVTLFLGILLAGGCKKTAEAQRSPGEQMAWSELIEKSQAAEKATATEAPAEASDAASVRTLGYQPANQGDERSVMTVGVGGPGSKLTPTRPDPDPVPSPRSNAASPATKSTPPPPAPGSGAVHTVRKGDSLFKIAKQYGTTPDAVKKSNSLKSDVIHPGQKLNIPGAVKS